ncbi:MAG: helix-turn-helix domain-containing protein [Methanobrevibacter sp.]|jgi:transcriptional regulator with XRE-family HTH domain|nr:helix-turn-helix domain-containing protein [Candidatus Methanoflexus mossambicus]
MNKKIGERLKKLRIESNYTQKQVADYLKINQGQLSKIENGNRVLNLSLLDKISALYDCSYEYILLESDEYNIPKIAFRISENNLDLSLVAKMNKIIGNLKFLRNLENEE